MCCSLWPARHNDPPPEVYILEAIYPREESSWFSHFEKEKRKLKRRKQTDTYKNTNWIIRRCCAMSMVIYLHRDSTFKGPLSNNYIGSDGVPWSSVNKTDGSNMASGTGEKWVIYVACIITLTELIKRKWLIIWVRILTYASVEHKSECGCGWVYVWGGVYERENLSVHDACVWMHDKWIRL